MKVSNYTYNKDDELLLATAIQSKQVIFLTQKADHEQSVGQLLKNWFQSSSKHEYTLYVIIHRTKIEVPDWIKEKSLDMIKIKTEIEETKPKIKKEKLESDQDNSLLFVQDFSVQDSTLKTFSQASDTTKTMLTQ